MKKVEVKVKEIERKVGEIFTVGGKQYQVAINTPKCLGCAFIDTDCWKLSDIIGSCASPNRKSKDDVIFVEV